MEDNNGCQQGVSRSLSFSFSYFSGGGAGFGRSSQTFAAMFAFFIKERMGVVGGGKIFSRSLC